MCHHIGHIMSIMPLSSSSNIKLSRKALVTSYCTTVALCWTQLVMILVFAGPLESWGKMNREFFCVVQRTLGGNHAALIWQGLQISVGARDWVDHVELHCRDIHCQERIKILGSQLRLTEIITNVTYRCVDIRYTLRERERDGLLSSRRVARASLFRKARDSVSISIGIHHNIPVDFFWILMIYRFWSKMISNQPQSTCSRKILKQNRKTYISYHILIPFRNFQYELWQIWGGSLCRTSRLHLHHHLFGNSRRPGRW